MTIEIYAEEPVKKGKCASCGDIEWLYEHKGRLICGMCKQTDQIYEQTMKGLDKEPFK